MTERITAAVTALLMMFGFGSDYDIATLYKDDVPIIVEIAQTEKQQQLGLSGREKLDQGKGMLFVYGEEHRHSFWMKDMNFSIDIIWLDSNLEIVHIEEGVSPETYPETFSSEDPALYVLEVPAGFSHANELAVGQRFTKLDREKK